GLEKTAQNGVIFQTAGGAGAVDVIVEQSLGDSAIMGTTDARLWGLGSAFSPAADGVSEQLVQVGKMQGLPQNIFRVFHRQAKERLVRSEQLNCRGCKSVCGFSGNPVNIVNGREGCVCK